MDRSHKLSSIEICAGAGGQALGLERAGFTHQAAYELDPHAHETLRRNRPNWNPVLADVRQVEGTKHRGVDLFAGGVPCPPFSIAGRQLGSEDDRDLFPAALEWIAEARPKAVLLENVPGLGSSKFVGYLDLLLSSLTKLGFAFREGRILNASDYGVSQLRPRFLIVALRSPYAEAFDWPAPIAPGGSVGELLFDLMAERGWAGAEPWRRRAHSIAPTLVGGSKLHGGPDLGPTRSKLAWRALGVDGAGVADLAPDAAFPKAGLPKLTVRMTARIQGFPDEWAFAGKKTAAYRQIGNAFPPPVAYQVGKAIRTALLGRQRADVAQRKLLVASA